MKNQLYRFTITICLAFIFASCSKMLDVKPVGHVEDFEFWDEFKNGYQNLSGENYLFFVFQNINNFQNAPVEIQREGSLKWEAEFPKDPWPPDNPPETIPAADIPPKEKPENHTRFLGENIYTKMIWDFLK